MISEQLYSFLFSIAFHTFSSCVTGPIHWYLVWVVHHVVGKSSIGPLHPACAGLPFPQSANVSRMKAATFREHKPVSQLFKFMFRIHVSWKSSLIILRPFCRRQIAKILV